MERLAVDDHDVVADELVGSLVDLLSAIVSRPEGTFGGEEMRMLTLLRALTRIGSTLEFLGAVESGDELEYLLRDELVVTRPRAAT